MQHDFDGSPVAQDYGSVIGTPFKVFLSNGVTEKLDEMTGKVATDIVDLPGLIATILQVRVMHPRKLSGDDLKYIRSALLMRSIDVAEVLDVSPEHYSRCESGTKTLSPSIEKFYRMFVYLQAECKDVALQAKLAKIEKEKRAKSIDENELKKAKEAMVAFKRLFMDMKIQNIFDPDDELKFSFTRGCRDQFAECNDEEDEGTWRKAA